MYRLFFWIVSLLCFYQAQIESLQRDYTTDRPVLCLVHMHHYLSHGQPAFDFSELAEDISLIPTMPQVCEQCICSDCEKVWWHEWYVNDHSHFFWNCACKQGSQDVTWDTEMPSWSYCLQPVIYPGYVDRNFKTYSALLRDHLSYRKENRQCHCTWPEKSKAAAEVSDHAYRLIRNVLENTHLFVLVDDPVEQGKFLGAEREAYRNAHGLTISLIANCFFFSHFDCVLDELAAYATQTFKPSDCRRIVCQLDGIRDALSPLFLKLYDDCLYKHPSVRIRREKDYLLKKLGYDEEFDSYYFTDNGSLHIAFWRGDDRSNLMLSPPTTIPEPLAEQSPFSQTPPSHQYPLQVQRRHDLRVHANYHLELGIAQSDQLQYGDAIAHFTDALSIDPVHEMAYLERAIGYFETDQLDLALADYQQFMRMRSTPAQDQRNPTDAECEEGLRAGIRKGAAISAHEFVPSTLSRLRGLGVGLWALTEEFKVDSHEFFEAMVDLISLLRYDTTAKMLLEFIPELRALVYKWPELGPYQKGEQFGYIMGKYGIDIFAGAGSINHTHKFRNLKRANMLLTMACYQQSPEAVLTRARSCQSQRKQMTRQGTLKIQWDRQNRYVIGSKGYREGRSVLTHADPQSLVNQWAGTGRPCNSCHRSQPGYQELVNCGDVIGYVISADPVRTQTPVTWATIHYAKDGVHIVPHQSKKP